MSRNYTKAIEVIRLYLKRMIPAAEVRRVTGSLDINVTNGSRIETLRLEEPMLDDMEIALEGTQSASYTNGLIRDATLRALVAIGRRGMVPDVDLSNQLLNETLDWRPHCRLDTQFGQAVALKLHEGLEELHALSVSLATSDVRVPEIEHERDVLGELISFYRKNRHLNSPGVTGQSMMYLKGAAFLWIRKIERAKRADKSERTRAARSVEYYEIVERFWLLTPFDRIPLPPILRDYVAHNKATSEDGELVGPGPSLDIGPSLAAIDTRLEERWRGAWKALQSDNPDKASQAANSMVEVLDKVIRSVCAGRDFRDVLEEKYPDQLDILVAQRLYISKVKEALHGAKHSTSAPQPATVEDLMHAAEGMIRTLLRK